MSITWYTERRPDEPKRALRAILAALDAEKVWYVAIDHLLARAWEEEHFPTIDSGRVIEGAWVISAPSEGATEDLGQNLLPQQAVDLYVERDVFVVALLPTPLSGSLHAALMRDIPERVRGDKFYDMFRVCLGPQDVYHLEDGEPVYDARAWVKVCLHGHGSVFYPRKMQPLAERVPEVVAVQRSLEKACGPMRMLVRR